MLIVYFYKYEKEFLVGGYLIPLFYGRRAYWGKIKLDKDRYVVYFILLFIFL